MGEGAKPVGAVSDALYWFMTIYKGNDIYLQKIIDKIIGKCYNNYCWFQ